MSFSSNQVRRTISGKSKQPTIATHSSNNSTTSSTFHNINNSNTIVTGSMTIADTIATTSSFDQQQHSAGRMISRSLSSEEKRNVEDTNSKGGSGGNGVGNGEYVISLLLFLKNSRLFLFSFVFVFDCLGIELFVFLSLFMCCLAFGSFCSAL